MKDDTPSKVQIYRSHLGGHVVMVSIRNPDGSITVSSELHTDTAPVSTLVQACFAKAQGRHEGLLELAGQAPNPAVTLQAGE